MALIQLRDKAAQQLKQAMQALFDNADDTLFEMADRASSNSEQNAFFEAMRDLRLKRKTIERGFLQRVFESFVTLNQYEIGKPAPQLQRIDKQPIDEDLRALKTEAAFARAELRKLQREEAGADAQAMAAERLAELERRLAAVTTPE